MLLLKDSIIEFEDLSSDELVVSIDDHEDVLGSTVFFGSPAEVRHGSLLLLVAKDDVARGRDFSLLLQKHLDIGSGAVSAGVVDEDQMIVTVVLHNDGLHVLNVKFIFGVVVAGNHNAER